MIVVIAAAGTTVTTSAIATAARYQRQWKYLNNTLDRESDLYAYTGIHCGYGVDGGSGD